MRRGMAAIAAAATLLAAPAAARAQEAPAKRATATGTGGAAATVDPYATAAAVEALRQGANAVDAAVVAAGVLGVTEPYSCGIGGGGFMLVYRVGDRRVRAIDSREAAPDGFGPTSLIDPATGQPIGFDEAVTSGLSVGVPGTVRGWDEALRRYGTWGLSRALQPGIDVARRGFEVDQAFADQTKTNLARFKAFPSTTELYVERDGTEPDPGDVLRNPDLAATYGRIARLGPNGFYRGSVAQAIVGAVRRPPTAQGTTLKVRPGVMSGGDLADYSAIVRRPTRIAYRGLDVYGAPPPSSGGSTVGEILNILEGYDLAGLGSREAALHRELEAERLAYADRAAFLGDPAFVDIPLLGLLSDGFAAARRALIGERAATSARAGDPYAYWADPSPSGTGRPSVAVERSGSTTHLTVADRDGNVVSYTFTIEQTGGNGMVVPGLGFLLNNELTDFEFRPPAANAPEAAKRPRSSMAPTIVLRGERPLLAVGSPGGASIVTTVAQVLVDRLALGATLPQAIAAPRVSQRNSATSQVEPAFLQTPEAAALTARGHRLAVTATSPEIGAATGIEFLGSGRLQAAAEPVRRGGGAAAVVRSSR